MRVEQFRDADGDGHDHAGAARRDRRHARRQRDIGRQQRVRHAERAAAEGADEDERDAAGEAAVEHRSRDQHGDDHQPHRRLGEAAQHVPHRRAVGGHRRQPQEHQRGGGQRLDHHARNHAREDRREAPPLRSDGLGPRHDEGDDQEQDEQRGKTPHADVHGRRGRGRHVRGLYGRCERVVRSGGGEAGGSGAARRRSPRCGRTAAVSATLPPAVRVDERCDAPAISSRIARTSSSGRPFGSSSGQSSVCAPGTKGHWSPHPIVISHCARWARASVRRTGSTPFRSTPLLAHDDEHLGVDAGARVGAGGHRAGLHRIGELVEQRRGHLRASRVVHAGEEDGGHPATSSRWSRSRSFDATSVWVSACSAEDTTEATTGSGSGASE